MVMSLSLGDRGGHFTGKQILRRLIRGSGAYGVRHEDRNVAPSGTIVAAERFPDDKVLADHWRQK
jgi:hypothetical protein